MFGLPQGLAPLAAVTPLTPSARFGAGLLVAALTAVTLLAWVARRLTAPARAPARVAKEELSEASQLESTPLAAAPPAALPDAQKLAALSTAADLLIGLLFALGLGVSGMLKPSKVAGERALARWVLGGAGAGPSRAGRSVTRARHAPSRRPLMRPPCLALPQASCPSSGPPLTPRSCA